MDEKKLLDLIRQSASGLTPPESLSPDAVEKLLTRKKKQKKRFALYRFAGAAAVFFLCAVSLWQVQRIQKYSDRLEQRMPQQRTATEEDEKDREKHASDSTAGSVSPDVSDSSGKTGSSDIDSGAADFVGDALAKSASEEAADSSRLPTAQSYEEIYNALYEQFYLPDDIVFDAGMGFTASVDYGAVPAEIAMEDGAVSDGTVGIDTGSDAASDGTAGIDMGDSVVSDGTAGIDMGGGMASDGTAGIDTGGGAASDGTAGIDVEDGAVVTGSPENSAAAGVSADGAASYEDSSAQTKYKAKYEMPEAAAESAVSSSQQTSAAGSSENETGYSKTNVQEFGVDEADIVKTDGEYLYILRQNGSVTIVSVKEPRDPRIVSDIPPAESGLSGTEELYVDGNTLNVIASRQDTSLKQEGDVYYSSAALQTVLYTYDITDRAAPELSGTVVQDGSYQTSRKNGPFLYLFTSCYPDLGPTYEESRIVPAVNGAKLKATDFYIPEYLTGASYLLIASVDIREPEKTVSKKALVSGTTHFYVSTDAIYIANENWNSGTTTTEILKFRYKDGEITGTAAGFVKGYLNNSFSLNEYDGFLRVVSTSYDDNYEEQNGLYILDESLDPAGSIENLAPGETIRSARFFGNTGYFVTFRQTDPLFSVDLSDPAAPRILGALKVSGFSSYLHFYREGLLLGLGYEADETTGVTSGVKLSMFDVSDPSDVTELHRLVIPGTDWCPSIENYKSILIDPQENLFGFFCDGRYLVFSYDPEQGFVSELVYDFLQDSILEQAQSPQENHSEDAVESQESGTYTTGEASADSLFSSWSDSSESADTAAEESVPAIDVTISDSASWPSISAWNTRGLYVGDTFYLAGDVSVIVFDRSSGYARLGALELPRQF